MGHGRLPPSILIVSQRYPPYAVGEPLPCERIKHILKWVFHGAKDNIIPIKFSKGIYEALKQYENIEFTIYLEAEHDSWKETYENKKTL